MRKTPVINSGLKYRESFKVLCLKYILNISLDMCLFEALIYVYFCKSCCNLFCTLQILALNKIKNKKKRKKKKKEDNRVGSLNELLLYDHRLFMSLGWISLLVL